MATKLEDLTITKVAFVPEGDNKKANVLLFKSKDGAPADAASAAGEAAPAPEQETKTLMKILLAIGKALGFAGDETAAKPPQQDKSTPEGQPDNKPNEPPAETNTPDGEQPPETKKGVTDVKIDKSKLTPEELAALEAIEKKAGLPEDTTPEGDKSTPPAAPPAGQQQDTPPAAAPGAEQNGDDDIYKGLHPAVKAELERLRKSADAAEERELTEVAKKYELIGKKAEELVPTLKALKAAGGNAYDQMIAVLDASLTAVEKSGLFSEVGKRGAGESDAWAAIEKHAEAIQKAAPTITWNDAIDKACEQHPDLVREYESKR